MNIKESIRRILREERNNYEMFIIRRFDIIDKILKEELEDQVPCYWKHLHRNEDPENGLDRYFRTVVRAVAERTLDIFPEYYREYDDEEYRIYGALLYTIKTMFGQEIEEYYNNEDCSTYYNLNESMLSEEIEIPKYLRRRLYIANEYIDNLDPKDVCNYWTDEENRDYVSQGMSDITRFIIDSSTIINDDKYVELYDEIYEYLQDLGYEEKIEDFFYESLRNCNPRHRMRFMRP